jgi:hypothetical protein
MEHASHATLSNGGLVSAKSAALRLEVPTLIIGVYTVRRASGSTGFDYWRL